MESSWDKNLAITTMNWKTAKPIIDEMTNKELEDFYNHVKKIRLKKVANQNFRISMKHYALIKLKSDNLDMTHAELLDYMLDNI